MFFFSSFLFQSESTVYETSANSFLDLSITYVLPQFTYNRVRNTIAVTLHVKNVDPDSIELAQEKSSVQLKFVSIGAGHFPISHAFYFGIASDSGTIKDVRTEAWDNNVIIQLDFDTLKSFDSYQAGISKTNYKDYPCPFTEKQHNKSVKLVEIVHDDDDEKVEVAVESTSPTEVQIEVIGKPMIEPLTNNAIKSKKQKKSNKKNRSYSESHCDELLADIEEEHKIKNKIPSVLHPNKTGNCNHQKSRTISESSNDEQHSCEPVLKGILKRRSSYNRSPSECSNDEHGKYSCSMDLGVGSFSSIPEERGAEMSESVRKTVTFDKNLCRKLLFK